MEDFSLKPVDDNYLTEIKYFCQSPIYILQYEDNYRSFSPKQAKMKYTQDHNVM